MAKPEDKTVLVVDDEEDVREYFSMALEDAGRWRVRRNCCGIRISPVRIADRPG